MFWRLTTAMWRPPQSLPLSPSCCVEIVGFTFHVGNRHVNAQSLPYRTTGNYENCFRLRVSAHGTQQVGPRSSHSDAKLIQTRRNAVEITKTDSVADLSNQFQVAISGVDVNS